MRQLRHKRLFNIFAMCLIFTAADVGASTSAQFPRKMKLQSLSSNRTQVSLQAGSGYKVIDFWASWCQSCKNNLVKLEPLQSAWQKSGSQNQIVAVSVDESKKDAKQFFSAENPGADLRIIQKYAWFDQDQLLSEQLKFSGVPHLVVVNPEGKIVMQHTGSLSSGDIKKIEKLVQQAR